MNRKSDFTKLSAELVQNHRMALISMLQKSGVLMPASATDDQLISAYLVSVADNPSFRKSLADYVSSGGKMRNADATTPTNYVEAPATTTTTDKNGSLLNSLLGSPAVNTLISGASTYFNSQQKLKEQQNEIKEAQLNLQNNQVVAAAGAASGNAQAHAGMSTGTVILLVVGVLVVVGGVILIVSKKPAVKAAKA